MKRFYRNSRIAQDEFHHQHDIKALAPTGSWTAFILAASASLLLVLSACAMNASHAWALGISEGPFKAVILAGASIGAAVLAPMGFMVATRGRGFSTRAVALLLACACLVYTSASSLGTIATARDASVSRVTAATESYKDKRALIDDARNELRSLKGSKPEIIERREQLTTILVDLTAAKPDNRTPARPDSQAAALGFYLRAGGWAVDDAAVGTWLALATVLILEAGAAFGFTVAAALYPVRPMQSAPAEIVAPVAPETNSQRKPGRRPINGKAMTAAERSRRFRAKQGAGVSLLN